MTTSRFDRGPWVNPFASLTDVVPYYHTGDIVTLGGLAYQALVDGSLAMPGVNSDWLLMSPGAELNYADLSANVNVTSTEADVSGLSIAVTAPARQFYVEVCIPAPTIADAVYLVAYISDGSNTHLAQLETAGTGASFGTAPTIFGRVRLPNASYAITQGNSYTFKVRGVSQGTTGTFSGGGAARSYISAYVA